MLSSVKKQTFERIQYNFIRIIYTNVQVENFSLQEIFTSLRRNLKTYDFEVFVIGLRKKRIEIFIKSVGKSFDFKTTRIFTTNLAFLISGKEKLQVCGTKQVEFDEFLAGSCIKGSVLAFDQKSWEKFCVHRKKIEKTIRYNSIDLTTGLVTPIREIKDKIEREKDKNYWELQKASWKKDAEKDKSKAFTFLKSLNEEKDLDSLWVDMDVSSSGLQILSGLTGSENGLFSTNFLVENNKKDRAQKQDFYASFHELLIKRCSSDLKGNTSKIVLEQVSKFSREEIKSLMLSYLFSESDFSRTKKIIGLIKPELRDINFNEFQAIARKIDNLFKEKFPEPHYLKSYLENILSESPEIKEEKGIHLFLGYQFSSSFYHVLKSEIKLSTGKSKSGSFVGSSSREYTDCFDPISAKHSICPNLIHRIDSELLCHVIQYCDQQGILISPSHDCFHVPLKHHEEIKKVYFDAFCSIILKGYILEYFIRRNSETEWPEERTQEMLKIFRHKRKHILSRIEKGIFKMSEFILTP